MKNQPIKKTFKTSMKLILSMAISVKPLELLSNLQTNVFYEEMENAC